MFPLIIESTKVVIANPARPNGAGFAGDHPALGALGVGALGVTEPSKSTLLYSRRAAAGHAALLVALEPAVPSTCGFRSMTCLSCPSCASARNVNRPMAP